MKGFRIPVKIKKLGSHDASFADPAPMGDSMALEEFNAFVAASQHVADGG